MVGMVGGVCSWEGWWGGSMRRWRALKVEPTWKSALLDEPGRKNHSQRYGTEQGDSPMAGPPMKFWLTRVCGSLVGHSWFSWGFGILWT